MPPTYTERRARTRTCGARRVSSKHSRPARTTSGSSTEALGSGKRENLSATSSSLRRRLASSFGHSLEANTHTLRRPGASQEVAAPPRSRRLPLSSGPRRPPQPAAPLLRAAASLAPGPGRYLPFASASRSAAAILSAPPRAAFSLAFSPPLPTDRRPLPPISARARRAPPSDWRRARRAANWGYLRDGRPFCGLRGALKGGLGQAAAAKDRAPGGRRQLPSVVLPRTRAADTRTLPLGKAESRGRLGVEAYRPAPPPSLRGEKAVPPPLLLWVRALVSSSARCKELVTRPMTAPGPQESTIDTSAFLAVA